MIERTVEVGYPYVYDLYYRVRNATLESSAYRLDFVDWVKAGVAYNVLGRVNPKRKIAYFAGIYEHIRNGTVDVQDTALFKTAVCNFYGDVFQLYQDHLVAQLKIVQKRNRGGSTEPGNLILLPSFEQLPTLTELLPSVRVAVDSYECKNDADFRRNLATLYVTPGSQLYRRMSMFYDYGVCREGDGVILGVE